MLVFHFQHISGRPPASGVSRDTPQHLLASSAALLGSGLVFLVAVFGVAFLFGEESYA